MLLGPAAEWNRGANAAAVGGGTSAAARRRAAAAAAESSSSSPAAAGKLGEALTALKSAAARGFRLWAEATAADAGTALAAALRADEALGSNETPKDWEEEKVSDGQAEPGAEDSSMVLRLPALPSPYVLATLHGAATEALRCGGHLAGAYTRPLCSST